MRKFLSGIMCLAIILISMPGLALAETTAETTAKQAFISEYLVYLDQSLDMQEAIMQGLQNNTIKFALDAELSDVNIVLEDGTSISNIPGRANIALAFNLSDPKAFMDFKVNASEYAMSGQVYFTREGLIVPRETIWSLAGAGADVRSLGKLDDLPPYIVYETGMSEKEFDMMQQAFDQAFNMQDQQLQTIRALMATLMDVIPDKCFYYSGTKPVLDLTRASLADLVDSLKEHRESVADQFMATMTMPPGMSDEGFAAMKEQMRDEIIAGIDSMNVEDIREAMKDLPITLQMCKFTISPGRIESLVRASGSLPDGGSFYFYMTGDDRLKGSTVSSSGTMDIAFRSSDFNLEMDLDSTASADLDRADFTLVLSGKAGDIRNTVNGKINMKGAFDWSSTSPIQVPQVTAYNSKRVKPQPKSYNHPITVFLDGDQIFFFDAQPLIKNGVTVVPLRTLSEALECEVEWQDPGTVIVKNGSGRDLVMNIGSTSYQLGDEEYSMIEAPFIESGRVMVPLRVVSEYCDLAVDWDGVNRIIRIYHLQP